MDKKELIRQIDECKVRLKTFQTEIDRLTEVRRSLTISRSNLCKSVNVLDVANMDMFAMLGRNIGDLTACMYTIQSDIEELTYKLRRLLRQLNCMERGEYFRLMDIIDIKLVINDTGVIRGHKL